MKELLELFELLIYVNEHLANHPDSTGPEYVDESQIGQSRYIRSKVEYAKWAEQSKIIEKKIDLKRDEIIKNNLYLFVS